LPRNGAKLLLLLHQGCSRIAPKLHRKKEKKKEEKKKKKKKGERNLKFELKLHCEALRSLARDGSEIVLKSFKIILMDL